MGEVSPSCGGGIEGGGVCLQMFPRQTNKTETGLGDLESPIVAIWGVFGSRVGRLGGCEVSLRLSVVEIREYKGSRKI